MASSSVNGKHETDIVVLSDSGDEDSGKSSTICLNESPSCKVKIQDRVSDSIQSDSTAPSESHSFIKFLDISRIHMKFPRDEKIISKLKSKYARARNSNEIDDFFEILCVKVEKISVPSQIYVILKEASNFLKNSRCGTNENIEDEALKKRVKKLESRLKDLHRKIKEVQAKEISMDDSEDDTNYIIECDLKKKIVKVYEYLCDITKCSSKDECKIQFNGTRYPEINRELTKLVNQEKDFPDYLTVLERVTKTNDKYELRIVDVESIAKEAFAEIGKVLKRRRMNEDAEIFGCYLTDPAWNDDSTDPANNDPALKERLEQNAVIGKKREEEEFEKYVQQQKIKEEEGNIEPREVADDDEQEESAESGESEEEGETEEDIAIIEDRMNYPSTSSVNLNGLSIDSSRDSASPEKKTSFTNCRKRYRSGSHSDNSQKDDNGSAKLTKVDDEDVIVLSD